MAVGRLSTSGVAPRRGRRRLLLVVVALAIVWLVLGFLRAPAIAQDFLARESPGSIIGVEKVSVFPAIPPFFIVQLEGSQTVRGGSIALARILAIEPFSGFVVSLAAG